MKKFILILFAIILIFILISCNTLNKNKNSLDLSVNDREKTSSDIFNKEEENKSYSLAKLYCIALDSFIPVDKGLNRDMEYIAIDIETLEITDLKAKNYIKEYFSKYNVPVIFESFESLKAKGKVGELNSLEGILLSIKNKKISEKKAIIEGSKFRSGIGAIGMHCKLVYKDGKWELTESRMSWIS
jgi:hypothetical protein